MVRPCDRAQPRAASRMVSSTTADFGCSRQTAMMACSIGPISVEVPTAGACTSASISAHSRARAASFIRSRTFSSDFAALQSLKASASPEPAAGDPRLKSPAISFGVGANVKAFGGA